MRSRYAPEIPSYTCPAIDEAIGELNKLSQTARCVTAEEHDTLVDEVDQTVGSVVYQLEQLRKANDALRRAAEWWKEHADELTSEVAGLNDLIAIKDQAICDLECA